MSTAIFVRILLIAAAVLAAADQSSRAASPASRQGVHTDDLNRQAQACTDFYEFANGTWRAENPIPASLPRWSRRVAALIFEVDAVRNPAAVQRIIRRLHELAVPVPFGVIGDIDYQDSRKFVAHIVAGGLGLPDRDYYLKDETRFVDARTRYRLHVAKILTLSGLTHAHADKAADDIVALEKRLAEASLDSATAADAAATDHAMSLAQLQQLTPHMDWERYFEEAKLPSAGLNVAEPEFMQRLDRELSKTPVETWKAYLKWQLLDSASPWLSRAFADESFSFHDQYLGKVAEMKSRAQRCVGSTDMLFGDALGQKYAQAYFPPVSRPKPRRSSAICRPCSRIKSPRSHGSSRRRSRRRSRSSRPPTYRLGIRTTGRTIQPSAFTAIRSGQMWPPAGNSTSRRIGGRSASPRTAASGAFRRHRRTATSFSKSTAWS